MLLVAHNKILPEAPERPLDSRDVLSTELDHLVSFLVVDFELALSPIFNVDREVELLLLVSPVEGLGISLVEALRTFLTLGLYPVRLVKVGEGGDIEDGKPEMRVELDRY